MNITKVEEVLHGEPQFRHTQVNKLLYHSLIGDWSEASVFPKNLREKLNSQTSLKINAEQFISKDKTIKILLVLSDGLKIESVLMTHDERNTVCVSSQVGCPLGCKFCATGNLGFRRNLTSEEIVEQILYFARILKARNERVTNVVFMGMGEPFLNYDNVLKAIRILNSKDKFNLGARKISISTSGIPEGIDRLSNEGLEVNLALSLHAPTSPLRSTLMPINKKFSLDEVMKAIQKYIDKTKRKVMFEYILIGGVNDTEEDAKKLSELLNHPLYHLNLIPYNDTGVFKASNPEDLLKFKAILQKNRIPFTQRFRFGTDINAACGQLALKNKVSTEDFEFHDSLKITTN